MSIIVAGKFEPCSGGTGYTEFFSERLDPRDNKTGYSDFLREQKKEPASDWPRCGELLHSQDRDVLVLLSEAIRSALQRRSLLGRAGDGLTTTEVASRIGVNPDQVHKLRITGKLLAVPNPKKGWLYPACQFKGNQIAPGLDKVISEFAVDSAWTRLYVLISDDPALRGRSPIDALKDGELEAVRRVVRGYGQQGAA